MKIKGIAGTVFVIYLLMMIGVNQSASALNYQTTLGVSGVPMPNPFDDSDTSHFTIPRDVAVDLSGNIWVADGNSHRVLKYDSNGVYTGVKIGLSGILACCGNDRLNFPFSVAADSEGNIWIADRNNNRVQKFDSSGTYLLTIGIPGTGAAGTGTNEVYRPNGVAVDSADNVYVTEQANHRVQKFDSNGVYAGLTIGTPGVAGSDNAHFDQPKDITLDSAGNIYVADGEGANHRVQKFDSSGTHLLTLGVTGVAGTDNAHFDGPLGVTVDSAGNIYVADSNNNRVQKFNSAGTYQSTLGETGVAATDNEHFDAPVGLGVDVAGNLYVADANNNRIQIFNAGGFASYVAIQGVCEVDLASGSLNFVAGDPIANGAGVGTGEISEVLTNTLGNLQSDIGVYGTDWTDGGALTIMDGSHTVVDTVGTGVFGDKTPLSTNSGSPTDLGQIAPQGIITTFWDVEIVMDGGNPGYSGATVQTITIDFSCV